MTAERSVAVRLGAAAVITAGFLASFAGLAILDGGELERLGRMAVPMAASLFGLAYFLVPRGATR